MTGISSRGEDPLFPHLAAHLATATNVDIAVAFVLVSGVLEIRAHLQDLLDRGGRLRLLTGDYFDVTDPVALQILLDLASDASDRVELRAFETRPIGFHPKTYIIRDEYDSGIAFIGSSNLTHAALRSGIEWNYRVVSSRDEDGFTDVREGFEHLFRHPETRDLTEAWVGEYAARRRKRTIDAGQIPPEPPQPAPEPNIVQERALAALVETRRQGNKAGLVVLATGLGKTWLSAFDSCNEGFGRILFVAHRDEILKQSLQTFRQIRPTARLGLYTGPRKDSDADVLFASVQTFARASHLQRFRRDEFDYIVIDEFHHAEAVTYRRIIQYFEPRFLLGLTATPERSDGGDLMALCGENLVYRCDLAEGIEHGLLCPFHYFGVPDNVDYRNIPWRSGRFVPGDLENAVATEIRANNTLEQYRKRAGKRTLAFCCSVRHAEYMAGYFREAGLRAVAVHAAPGTAPRARSLEQLRDGGIDIICAVDIFNEGLDLPAIDTVMMLRPTESRILWLQQIGRGLRRSIDKPFLTIIDYIGNHRSFLIKPQALFGIGSSDAEIARTLALVRAHEYGLPTGCEVTYELEAIDILTGILRPTAGIQALEAAYEDLCRSLGTRPTASQVLHDGLNPRLLRVRYGSWLEFVRVRNGLEDSQISALDQYRDFLDWLETTQMTRSYKMLVLASMLNQDQFPGHIDLSALRIGVQSIVGRSARLTRDLSIDPTDASALESLLVRYPIDRLTRGIGIGGRQFFNYEGGVFRTAYHVVADLRRPLQELTRELVDWRLAEYLLRGSPDSADHTETIIKINHSSGRPILQPFDRGRYPGLPRGWTRVSVDDSEYELNFVEVAVNVARERPDGPNVLPEILRRWYGANAGAPGTHHYALLRSDATGYRLEAYRGNPEDDSNSTED